MKKIQKLKTETLRGDYEEMLVLIFNWCSEMHNKINEIIDVINKEKK